jgi:hypothetical protein
MYSNLVSPRTVNINFKRVDFIIQKGLVAKFIDFCFSIQVLSCTTPIKLTHSIYLFDFLLFFFLMKLYIYNWISVVVFLVLEIG